MGHTIDERYPFSNYAVLRSEVQRVATEMRKLQAPNSPSGRSYMVKLSDEFGFAMNTRIEDLFLSSFHGIFSISCRKDAPGLWLFVHQDYILFFAPKITQRVHPHRVTK